MFVQLKVLANGWSGTWYPAQQFSCVFFLYYYACLHWVKDSRLKRGETYLISLLMIHCVGGLYVGDQLLDRGEERKGVVECFKS